MCFLLGASCLRRRLRTFPAPGKLCREQPRWALTSLTLPASKTPLIQQSDPQLIPPQNLQSSPNSGFQSQSTEPCLGWEFQTNLQVLLEERNNQIQTLGVPRQQNGWDFPAGLEQGRDKPRLLQSAGKQVLITTPAASRLLQGVRRRIIPLLSQERFYFCPLRHRECWRLGEQPALQSPFPPTAKLTGNRRILGGQR